MQHARRVLTAPRSWGGPGASGAVGPAGVLGILVGFLLTLLIGSAAPAHADEGTTPPGKAWIRAGHLVPGVGTTRIDLTPASGPSTSVVMSPAASYGDVTPYQKLDPGDYTVTVRPQGAGLDSAPMLQRAFTVVAGKATTLAVVGTAQDPRLAVLDDDLTLPAANAARVRVLPAASRTPTLSVVAQNGPTLTTGAVLGQATPYASVPSGRWTLDLASAGGPAAQQTVDLASGSVYTAIVLDSSAGDGVTIVVVTDAAGAMTAPQGAAQTGGGGTAAQRVADDDSMPAWSGWALAGSLAALTLASGVPRGKRRGPAATIRSR